MRRTTIRLAGIAAVLLFTLSGYSQQRKNKFEIALGVNAVDVYLNNGYGLNAKAEESFISDIFTTNDWNINSKARDTYTDEGNKESVLPPISLRAAYYFSDQLALGLHFSANYLDIIDLCYNAIGLPDMDFINFEGFLRFSPLEETTIEPYAQLTMGQSWVGPRTNMHAGLDLGVTLRLSDRIGLGYTAGVKTMFGTGLSEYLQHTLEIAVRFNGPNKESIRVENQRTATIQRRIQHILISNNKSLETAKIPEAKTTLSFNKHFPVALTRNISEVSRGIFFDYNSSDLNNSEITKFILPDVITELNRRPNLKITITGYADLVGSVEYNLSLSLARAQAVADFLIEGGIDPGRITVRALGENEPAIDTEREAALNRRVVITEDKD